MEARIVSGDGRQGTVEWQGAWFPFRLEDGFIEVYLPFVVDQARLRDLLTNAGWAVALGHERLDSLGWGEGYDIEAYYPYWVAPAHWRHGHQGKTVFSFPPRDYEIQPALAAGPPGHAPYLGRQGLQEIARWLPYLTTTVRE